MKTHWIGENPAFVTDHANRKVPFVCSVTQASENHYLQCLYVSCKVCFQKKIFEKPANRISYLYLSLSYCYFQMPEHDSLYLFNVL